MKYRYMSSSTSANFPSQKETARRGGSKTGHVFLCHSHGIPVIWNIYNGCLLAPLTVWDRIGQRQSLTFSHPKLEVTQSHSIWVFQNRMWRDHSAKPAETRLLASADSFRLSAAYQLWKCANKCNIYYKQPITWWWRWQPCQHSVCVFRVTVCCHQISKMWYYRDVVFKTRLLQHTVLFKAVKPVKICEDLPAFSAISYICIFYFFSFQAINVWVNLPALRIPNSLSLTHWKDRLGRGKKCTDCFGEKKTVNWNQEKGNEAVCTAHHSFL